MVRHAPIPDKVDTDSQLSFRRINQILRNVGNVLLRDKRSMRGMGEGQVGFVLEGNTLYSYVNYKGKVYRQVWEEDRQ